MHFRYNMESDTWTELAPMSIARELPGCAVVSNKMLVMGGIGIDRAQLRSVEYYNLALNKWLTASPMTIISGCVTTGVLNGLVYVLGTIRGDTGRLSSVIEKYSIEDDTWVQVSHIAIASKIHRNTSKELFLVYVLNSLP